VTTSLKITEMSHFNENHVLHAHNEADGHVKTHEKINIIWKKALPVPAVAMSKPRPSPASLHAHKQANGQLKTLVRK
jgi:hypothetical protein